MTVVFKSKLEQMAEGELEKIYAQAVISVDQEEIRWDGTQKYSGSIAIYSRNDVEVTGTAVSLHPAVLLKENSFQGNTTIHYELLPMNQRILGERITDGILICYNGGEYMIPLHLIAAEEKRINESLQEESTEIKTDKSLLSQKQVSSTLYLEKEARIRIARLCLERMILQKKDEGTERQEELLEKLIVHIQSLSRLRPDCVRYKLYDAAAALEAGDARYAARLESSIRNVIISSKRYYCTEYCILLYLQYGIALSERQYREAGVKKQQLRDYIDTAIAKDPMDQDVILLLCSDCLGLMDTEPLDLWEMLQSIYQQGSNSPYLFFYGACLLQDPQVGRMLDTGMDQWTGRCLYEGNRRNLITRELAEQAAQCRPEFYSLYICKLYRSLYDKFQSRSLLSALCTVMIRCDVRSGWAFTYYEQAADDGMKIARLYDYCIHTLPSGYEKPINREILLYFSLDEYMNPQIYLKLCLNVLQFYKEDYQIFDHYGSGMVEFLKNQIMRSNWSEDLALLAGEILTAQMLDTDLAQALIPMLYLVQVKAEVLDGCQIIFESGIYKEPQTGVFKDGKTCICVPGGNGRFHVQDQSGKRLNGINLKIRPLMQDEELMHRCEELCPDDMTLLLMKTHAWIMQKEYDSCDFRLCVQYLRDESLDMDFRKQLLVFVLNYMKEDGCENTDLQRLCQCADMMNEKQLISLIEILIRRGRYTEAASYLPSVRLDSADTESLLELANALVQYPENESNIELLNLLIYLMDQDLLEDRLLHFLAVGCQRQKDIMVKLYHNCRERKISCPELNQCLLLRLTMQEEVDKTLLQELFLEMVNMEQAELLIKAALNKICCYYIYGWCEMEADVMASLQSMVIHSGSVSNLTIPCQLACLKYDQEMGMIHEIEHMILKEMCVYVLQQGIKLDFVQREAAQYGIAVYPVLQVNVSAGGDFSNNCYEDIKAGREKVWVEYYVEGEKTGYRLKMEKTYGCLYSTEIVMFAGEKICFRFHCGSEKTSWKSITDWNYDMGQSNRYFMLQQIALRIQNGEPADEHMKAYESLLKRVESIGKKVKES